MFVKSFVFFLMFSFSLWPSSSIVVFDFGGVLVRKPNRQIVIDFICESIGISEATFHALNHGGTLMEKKGYTEGAFWIDYARKQGIDLPPDWNERLDLKMIEATNVQEEMYELVNALKKERVPVALFTNTKPQRAFYYQKLGLYAPFCPCFISFEIGSRKPSPESYAIVIESLQLPPQKIVFIDDKKENVEGARKAGIDAIHFQSVSQLKKALQTRGILKERVPPSRLVDRSGI